MSSPFDRPAPPGDQFSCETHVGALLVIDVLEHVKNISTRVSKDPQDAIRANVFVISPQATVAEEFHNTLLFPRMLVARLQQSLGRKVLGVLTGQPGVTRDGRNVPYDLDDPTDPMEAAAVQAMTKHQMAMAPAPQQWGQQPAQQPDRWGQPQQGPPPGWGAQPAQQPAAAPAGGGWGAQPQQGPPPGWGQQQLPAPPDERPPWEAQQPAPAPPWGYPQA